jgi:hypothetical protein
MASLPEIEQACGVAMGMIPADAATRAQAQAVVISLGESLSKMDIIQAVLVNSASDPAITACAQACQKLCTDHWNSLSDGIRVALRECTCTRKRSAFQPLTPRPSPQATSSWTF